MLTKRDLRWTQKFFSFYSKLMWIPVTFKPVMMMSGGGGGQMETGRISIWRRIGFKLTQLLVTCQTLFISLRTLEYVIGGDAGSFGEGSADEDGDELELDWDIVPIILCFTIGYHTGNVLAYSIFDAQRELNTKVFNEFIKLRGKIRAQKNYHAFI